MPVVVWCYACSAALAVGPAEGVLWFRGHPNLNLSPMSSQVWWRAASSPAPTSHSLIKKVWIIQVELPHWGPAHAELFCSWPVKHGLPELRQPQPPSCWWAPTPGSPILSTAPLVLLFAAKTLQIRVRTACITAGETVPSHCLPLGRKVLLTAGFPWRQSSTPSLPRCPKFNWNRTQSRLLPSWRNEVCERGTHMAFN